VLQEEIPISGLSNPVMMGRKRSYGMGGVVMKITPNTTILSGVRTFGLEWGVIRLWTRTRPVIGHATTFGNG
jgi:hypothetical protein